MKKENKTHRVARKERQTTLKVKKYQKTLKGVMDRKKNKGKKASIETLTTRN